MAKEIKVLDAQGRLVCRVYPRKDGRTTFDFSVLTPEVKSKHPELAKMAKQQEYKVVRPGGPNRGIIKLKDKFKLNSPF